MTYKNHLIKSSAIIGSGNVASRALGFIFFIIVARMLVPAEYGFIRYILALASLVGFISTTGYQLALTRYLGANKENANDQDVYFSNSIAAITVLLLLTTIAVLLVTEIVNKLSYWVLIVLIGLTVYYTYLAIIRGLFDYKKYTLFNIGNSLVKVALVGALFYLLKFYSSHAVLVIFAYSCMIPLVVLELFRPSHISFRKTLISKNALKELTKFAIPVFIASGAGSVMIDVDIIFIELFIGMEAVGFYGVARTLTQIFSFIPMAISTVLVPEVAGFKNQDATKKYLKLSLVLTAVGSLLLFIGIYFFGDLLIRILFTERYIEALKALYILSAGMVIYSIYIIIDSFWVGIGKPSIPMIAVSITAGVNIIGNIYLIPKLGIFGAGMACTLSWLVGLMIISIITLIKRKAFMPL